MTEDELKAIEARAKEALDGFDWNAGTADAETYEKDVPALVAEVRQLRDIIRRAHDIAENDIQLSHNSVRIEVARLLQEGF